MTPVVYAVSPNVGALDDTMAVTISGAFFLPGNGLRVEFGSGHHRHRRFDGLS